MSELPPPPPSGPPVAWASMDPLASAPPVAPSFVSTRPAWHRPARLGALAVAGTAFLAVWNPNAHHVPLCPLKFVTGLDCPLCGGTRAVHSLTRLDVVGAADHNLLFTASVPFLVVAWVLWLHGSLTGRRHLPAWPRWATPVAWVVVGVFGVLRNVPAFHWLNSSA